MRDQEMWRKYLVSDIKGRIAEAIVEQMLVRSGIESYFFGIEWRQLRHPGEKEIPVYINGWRDTFMFSDNLPVTPDFLILSNGGYEFEFIEVKFRNLGVPFRGRHNDDFDLLRKLRRNRNEEYEIKIAWVSQSEIKVIVYPYLDGSSVVFEDVLAQKWGVKEEVFAECLKYLPILYEPLFSGKNKK